VEGFSESLAKEIAPFGISVTIVEPGPFRTEFLAPRSISKARLSIPDYESRRAALLAGVEQRNGRQPGDPGRLAHALVTLARSPVPPLRFLAGALANAAANEKLAAMRSEFDAWRELSLSTDGTFDAVGLSGLSEQMR
jgi:NAD(P)-dependent dehydrogenase (short-subunit alcohol dehydrogenase family)